MKKKLLFALTAILMVFMWSCDKEGSDGDNDLDFTTESVEKQKERIEESGVEFSNAIERLNKTQAVKVLDYLSEILDFEIFDFDLFTTAQNWTDIKIIEKNILQQNYGLRSIDDDGFEWGEYEYDFNRKELVKTKSLNNKLVIKFPANNTSSQNNAILEISYTESNVSVPGIEDEYLPSKIVVTLKVDSQVAMSFDFSGDYFGDGTPKSINTTVKVDNFTSTVSLSNNGSKATIKYDLKEGSTVLMELKLEATGELRIDAIDDESDDDIEDMIHSLKADLKVVDIGARGGVSEYQKFQQELDAIYNNYNLPEREALEEETKVFNKYISLIAYFVKENSKFADIEFYVDRDEYGYYMAPRFVMSDGSKMNAEEFMNLFGIGSLFD